MGNMVHVIKFKEMAYEIDDNYLINYAVVALYSKTMFYRWFLKLQSDLLKQWVKKKNYTKPMLT